ncbi:A/G-specific adenine glycosylase [Helicobacter enhydrae]|uniref:A/G-specific adenine glycosylase n=1 Tax=Helicobacter enhydrae TaxID=222136 RepID=UPI000B105675|nr:A/G-specific adenine glycosylase [Helicobacter enhydrae]
MKNLHARLLEWYQSFGRLDLPWRNLPTQSHTPNPKLTHIQRSYGVYVSEIMLQQTQVNVVLEHFYFPFLERFPTLKDLAQSSEDTLLHIWQGLGYYTRARNMHQTAQICLHHHNGTLPSSVAELTKLKGIGEYTAGAIACFGFGKCESFVDGNIARVLSRLFALSAPTATQLKDKAHLILNHTNPFDHNQALLDLGATLCTPQSPSCLLCPLSYCCQGKHSPHLYPLPKKRESIPLELHLGFVIQDGKISLVQSQEKLYFGLYNPIRLESTHLQNYRYLGSFKHSYTKYKITAKIYQLPVSYNTQARFFTQQEIQHLPLSNLCKKALQFL